MYICGINIGIQLLIVAADEFGLFTVFIFFYIYVIVVSQLAFIDYPNSNKVHGI